jgi:hypothetical protein
MKVIGIITETNQLRHTVVSGTSVAPTCESGKFGSLPYPPDLEIGTGLDLMQKTLYGLIEASKPCKVVLVVSVAGPTGKRSVPRIVVETLVKIAAHNAQQELELLHPVSLRSKEGKFESLVGSTPEATFNGGEKFRPAIIKDAFLAAWAGLQT